MPRRKLGKRAWRTTCIGITSIVSASTRGKAILKTWGSALDAGYRAEWKDVRARRAPEYDGWASQDSGDSCWCEEDLRGVVDGQNAVVSLK